MQRLGQAAVDDVMRVLDQLKKASDASDVQAAQAAPSAPKAKLTTSRGPRSLPSARCNAGRRHAPPPRPARRDSMELPLTPLPRGCGGVLPAAPARCRG